MIKIAFRNPPLEKVEPKILITFKKSNFLKVEETRAYGGGAPILNQIKSDFARFF